MQGDEQLMESLNEYEASKPQEDHLSPYIETLAGGNPRARDAIYFSNMKQLNVCDVIPSLKPEVPWDLVCPT